MDEPIELPDQGDNIIRTNDMDPKPNIKSLGYELFRAMKEFKGSLAQIDAASDKRDTYSSRLRKCVRVALEMKARGITADDVISPCTTNHIDTYVPLFAALFIGAKVASLDPSLSLSDTKHLLKLVEPKLIFASPNALDKLEESLAETGLKSEIVVFGKSDEHASFDEFLRPSDLEESFKPVEADVFDTALIYFTSGTTGLSKGICLNHYSLIMQTSRHGNLLATGMFFSYSPLYWLSSTFVKLMTTLSGGTIVTGSDFTPEKTWRNFEKYKITSAVLSPSEIMQLVKHGRPPNLKLPHLRAILMGGSWLSPDNISAIRSMFSDAAVIFGYGQTEIAGGVLGFPPNLEGVSTMTQKGNSVGQPLKGIWYKIVDPETEKVLGPNQPGELRLKSKFGMNGYHRIDSSGAWDADGWLKTGDICYYDEDHCFFVVDRLKEMIKYRGWQISPAFIESVLEEHPAVKKAVVIPIPHDIDVEHALGLVELTANPGKVTPDELVKYVSDKIKDDKKALHGGVKFVSEFPYTPSGKVRRNLLRNKILAEIVNSTVRKL